MQDFIRIGGPITSAPLNEDFRRLLNAISIANTNLVFPEENAVVNTISDMMAIINPDDAQACYVVSSGEFYRYSKADNKWHKIMDIGQTFRQGFLNSGAVVLENDIKLEGTSKLIMPKMLVYFKNQPGDDRYLKGMYLIEEKTIDIKDYSTVSGANSYTILVDSTGTYTIQAGLPNVDYVDRIFIGTFVIDGEKNILGQDFVYTLPDIAFTADRGQFLFNGGQANGLSIDGAGHDDINRAGGYYYDEGINYTKASTDRYPIDTDNGSNFDLKYFEAEEKSTNIYYITPTNGLNNGLENTGKLIHDVYWDDIHGMKKEVPNGFFTIQHHLVTPNGQNILVYGTELFNSMTDAISNLNTVSNVDFDFPCVEATKIVIGNPLEGSEFDSADRTMFRAFKIGKLSQVGTVSPEFADNIFKLYSGDGDDNSPASMRFDLKELQDEDYTGLYDLGVLPSHATRTYFYKDSKYVKGQGDEIEILPVTQSEDVIRQNAEKEGYRIADDADLRILEDRVKILEAEIWETYNDTKQRYEQSVRYRLNDAEERLDTDDSLLEDHKNRIITLENNKVKKETNINGYTLGDTSDKNEIKTIDIKTGDIAEGQGLGNTINLWYTEDRVKANPDVAAAKTHADTKSISDNATLHAKVNPHNLSTDDINILADTQKIFVTPDEERRIRADRLPEDTIQALLDLDAKNLDNVHISYQEGSSENPGPRIVDVGDIKNIRFYQDGVRLSMDSDDETLILECIGQVDDTKVMFKNRYASLEAEYPDLYGGYVDNAVNAEYAYYVNGIESANANQYYGTNADNKVGVYDLPVYVSTADAEAFTSLDQFTFEPIDGSVQEKHLETTLKDKINNNYHAIYDGGTLKSAEVNTFDFGNNLTVTINGNKATINANGAGGPSEDKFANLVDVDVVYTGNEGKMLVVNPEGDGITLAKTPSTKEYMLRSVYVEPTDISKVKKAVHADNATLADSANNALAVNNKSVNNDANSDTLWTSDKIISNTSLQIRNEGVNTYSGTSVPANSLGKNGDIYVLIES